MEQRLYELPEGWEWITLGETTKVQSGTGFPKQYQGQVGEELPFLKVGDMNLPGNESRIASWNNSISPSTAKQIKAKIMPAGTVIFPKIGGAISTNKKRMLTVPSAFDNNVMGLAAKGDLTKDFLYWYLQGFDLSEWASSAALPSMKASTIKEHRIPLPPLNEQKRIVAKLDALFTRIDAAITHLQETLELCKALFASALDEVFSDAANRFEVKPISEIFTITSGDGLTQKNMVKDGPYDVYGGNGISGRHNEYNRSGLNVVIGRVGAWCGNVRLVDGDIWVTDNAFFVKSYLADVFEPYLVAALQHLNLRDTANQAAQPVISYKGIKELPMPLPPMKEQAQIVTHLDALAEHTCTLEAETQVRLDQLATLKSSLLDSAFRGQL